MLRELAVSHLALIDDVRVELHPGFCAWTGETGAGKSLLLGAIGLLLGERGSADSIRAGSDELRITGRFELNRPSQKSAAEELLGCPIPDDELVLTRRLSRSGRSSALINEQPVSIATLRKLGEMLVDVHGQRESYSLLQPAYQLELLDAFGKLGEPVAAYREVAERVRELRRKAFEKDDLKQTRQRELALLRFEKEELETAQLQKGERASLLAERERLLNARDLAKFNANVADRLADEEGSMLETLSKLLRPAQQWARLDPRLAEVARRLEAMKPEINDLAQTCRHLSEVFEADPERLDVVERRLQTLKKLEAKYGKASEDLVAYRDGLADKERSLQTVEDDNRAAGEQLKSAFAELVSTAATLSKGRAKVAKKLAAEAEKHLRDLGMPKAELNAVLEPVPLTADGEVPLNGGDHLELMLMANPGEAARPLRKVASGGELSRTMLALKTVLAAHDPVRTLVVFDEIDSNVGGRLGDALGRKLAKLGQSHQVLCVTHLPQVACYAASQWSIRKSSTAKRTSTSIVPLNTDAERIEELSLMLRGEARTETTQKEAAEMLKAAKKVR